MIPKRNRSKKPKQKQKLVTRPGVEAKRAREEEQERRQRRLSTLIWTSALLCASIGLVVVGFAFNVFDAEPSSPGPTHSPANGAENEAEPDDEGNAGSSDADPVDDNHHR